MTDLQRGILCLIQSGLSGDPMVLPEGFSLQEAAALIQTHQITGLCCEGAAICGVDKALMQEMTVVAYKQLIASERQQRGLKKLFAAFDAQGIDYLPVKGTVLKALYPRPELRLMGDADILIRMEQYDRIRPVMEQLGYTELQGSHHELPWQSKELHLELHKYLVPEHHALEHTYFLNAWDRAEHLEKGRYQLSTEDAFLYTFAHYAKHYRAGGIGIRQLLDLWLLLKAYPQMDMAAVERGMEALCFQDFFRYTCQLLKVWFEGAPEDDRMRHMTDYIFASGCWGSLQNHRASAGVKATVSQGSKKKARLKMGMEALFPDREQMQRRYQVLKKAPVLLPVMWPVRWVEAALFRRNNIRNYQENIAGASDERIDSFAQSLEYVGLGFH